VTQKRFRVLVLADAGSFHTERYISALRKQSCHPLLLSLEPGPVRHLSLKSRGPIRTLHYVLAVPQIRKILKRFRPDVINPHFASGYGFIAALASRGRHSPLVCHVWGSDILIVPHKSSLHRRKTAYALRNAGAVIADSEYILNEAARLSPLRAGYVYPWGIEREFLALHKSDYRLGRPLRVIVPRAQEVVYNNLFIVKALAPLLSQNKMRITFPSFGSQTESFKRFVTALVGDTVEFYDKLPRPEFLQFMSEHDVYLSASRSDSSPASLIEAMALGLLPVAADVAGVREWLSPESGFLFVQDNEESLRNVFSAFLKTENPREGMRIQNLERVKREALFEDNIAAQIGLMKKLAGWEG